MDERYVGGLWCHQVLEHLDTYVEGELSPALLAAVQDHVAECDACARFGAAYASLVAELSSQRAPDLRSDQLERLQHRLDLDT